MKKLCEKCNFVFERESPKCGKCKGSVVHEKIDSAGYKWQEKCNKCKSVVLLAMTPEMSMEKYSRQVLYKEDLELPKGICALCK